MLFYDSRMMMSIHRCSLPPDAFLKRYAGNVGYADCFRVDVPGTIGLGRYVEAFYTTRLFKAERAILSLAGHPSSDAEAALVAQGEASRFAAWHVEARADDQLLMCDVTGRTRSWFKVASNQDGDTTLYFGSAVTPVKTGKAGRKSMGLVFNVLMPVHILYSRALLAAAKRKIARSSQYVMA
ncbi:hypothetical protein AX760_21555 [Pararhizobium antarcticum]|uniref:DUF2867 domain-containing protein n=1 Tax=Pararhizobium antarcticum TaxID=1798805 RepID=A0A657LP89_9HYPH|nr:hypothetical protein AX760_21555 [Pararhizobium antarcticum]